MSNDAFYHDNQKVSDAMVILLGVMIKRGPRQGHRNPKDFAPKLQEDIYPTCLERLGRTPEAQLWVIRIALRVAIDRHLIGFDPKTQKLFHTRKGWRARRAYLQRCNTAKKGRRSKAQLGQPAFAR